MKNVSPSLNLIANRSGLTLLISMILLIVMSLLGVVAVNLAVEESRIAENYASSALAVAWAEAGAEAARQEIIASQNPEMRAYACTDASSSHYYPDTTTRNVRYCIELIRVEIRGDASTQRGSGQDSGSVRKTYHYKVDSYSVQNDENGNEVVLRHVQTFEQQTRASR